MTVWPFIAATMSAVRLPRSQLRVEQRAADAVATRALPNVVLDIEFCCGGDELLDHLRVALHRGQDERSAPAERGSCPVSDGAQTMHSAQRALPSVALDVEVGAGVD